LKWNKFTLKTTTNAVDFVSGIFIELGIDGIEISDNVQLTEEERDKQFIDILPELPEDDGTAYISFYLDESEDTGVINTIKEKLEELRDFVDVGEGTITISQTSDIDWINNWKKYFKAFTVDDIIIKPTWEQISPEDKDKMVISIDPGTAFGTGMHETTKLCIRQLRKYVNGTASVLDIGCGSGILSILASKFGSKEITAIDVDENAITATRENMIVNDVNPELMEIMQGNIIGDKEIQDKIGYECYDIVVANILAEIIIPLTGIVTSHIKQGGIYITSGIIDNKEEAVVKAILDTNRLEIVEITRQGDWVSVTAQKI
jgi:ribosomal protein L11 methyltransferase